MRLSQRDIISLEQRLAFLGFHPGAVDGRIDASTRTAIREYQSSRRLVVSGYFNDAAVSGVMRETSSAADTRGIIAGEAIRGLLGILGN